ncbi:hypothetical protein MO867_10645 [Microbulbifer sp. OS29]|uniref:Uncharacterized protein n=1 Tax=Microbulbifer okhotskensis TaxID=2926617 RepID=A0A9X2J537_9GAMM|nr:hypothetical protein [Microbulbifer okhotskensis]
MHDFSGTESQASRISFDTKPHAGIAHQNNNDKKSQTPLMLTLFFQQPGRNVFRINLNKIYKRIELLNRTENLKGVTLSVIAVSE